MDKVGSPRGLIRYATRSILDNGRGRKKMWHRVARPRVLLYTGILVVVVGRSHSLFRAPFRRRGA